MTKKMPKIVVVVGRLSQVGLMLLLAIAGNLRYPKNNHLNQKQQISL